MDHTLAEQRPDECSKEPIMRPARPSSPRNQDVSYVLASVFGDIHSQDVLHEDTILNLETSRTHDPDFHDYYVQLLKEIRTERTERLSALKQVEEHMMSAYQLASQENLSLKHDDSKKSLGIPQRHVGIGNYLDTDLLARYNLLTPGSYLRPSPPSLSSPTIPDLPNFMKNTEVMEEHEKARTVTINRNPAVLTPQKIKRSTLSAGNIKVRAPVRAAWRDSMNPDVRIEEQKGLEKLQAKSKFLKTKRFDKKEAEKEEEEVIFRTVPSQILFESYEIGEVYQQKVKIKNVSTSSRQLKVLPPKTKHFSVEKSVDPSQNGAVAPGLAVEYTVTFMPESLGSYQDLLQIIPQGGALTNVPFLAERPPPSLSLPDVLDCGFCLIHGTLRTQFRCVNKGGSAIFQLYPAGMVSDTFLFNDLPPPEFELKDSGFTVTPTSFALERNQEVILNVEFKPSQVSRVKAEFTIAANNCTSRNYTVTAEGESCAVKIIAVSGGDTVDYDIRSSDESNVVVNFEDQNPGTKEEKIFILRNCVNVPLHYNWEMCKILTEEGQQPDSALLLRPDEISPFQISPANGILEPASETSFTISCHPLKPGKYDNTGRLWVDDIPSLLPSGLVLEKYDAQHITLAHLAQPHKIRLEPPALIVPGESVVGYTVSKTVKIINESISSANVSWKYKTDGDVKFNIRPQTFTVGTGCSRTVEIDIETESPGDKEAHVQCYFENVEKPANLFVKAKFRGPRVTIDAGHEDPVLDFGYIHYRPGCVVQRQFDIVNQDGVEANWVLREMDHCINAEYGESEFQFAENSGTLGPYQIRHAHITFKPNFPRSLKSVIECSVENGTGSKIRVIGEIQEPNVVLKQSVIDLGVVFVGVPVTNVAFFESLNFADCDYVIRSAEGKDKAFGFIEFEEQSGMIYAGATQRIRFHFTGKEPAIIDDFTVAIEIGDNKVLALGIKAEVKGLYVVHETPDIDQVAPETNAEQMDQPNLDFGTVDILNPTTRVLKIINKSNIATHFQLEVEHFKGNHCAAPPISALGDMSTKSYRPVSHLLTKTNLLLDPSARSGKQNDAEYWKKQLSSNKGVCFTAVPASGYLPGNGVTIITITGNSDMWGTYTDTLVSRVGDLEEVRIPISMTVVNSPLYYKLSNNNKPTVRFGCYPLNEKPVSRTVQISNQGPEDIRLDWQTFNIVPKDSQLLDVNFFIGDAFPKKGQEESPSPNSKLIRLSVSPHDGRPATGPFSFDPDQVVIPGRGTAKVTLSFDPSCGVGECSGDYKSFALAYQSLDSHTDSKHCSRLQGEDVPQLKINMTGKVEVPEVVVTAEEHGFTFKLMAGMINSKVQEHTKIHKMSLLNSSKLHLGFSIAASLPFILLENKEGYSLIPRQKTKIDHGFVLSEGLLKVLLDSTRQNFKLDVDPVSGEYRESDEGAVEVIIEEKLLKQSHNVKQQDGTVAMVVQEVPETKFHLHSHIQLHYNNNHIQSIPVHARIILPSLYISPQSVDFGTCLVGQTSQVTVRLINPSNSPMRWYAQYTGETGEGEFSITPSSGEFMQADSCLLSISYTAKTNKICNGVYRFVSSPGKRAVELCLAGTGSHDERMQKLL